MLDHALRNHEWARNEDENEEQPRPRRILFLDGAICCWCISSLGGAM